ncbi:DUF4955 domain-containing protein [Flavobacterium sp. PL12]|uniref:DUF4955 domain-containing protein n=1 Tax=Flavobacterium sp. PL12 TaxID=3071718 RepID=UPI00319DCA9E
MKSTNLIKHKITKISLIFSLLMVGSVSGQTQSKVFEAYKKDKTTLPDFSYVGYHNGEQDIPLINTYKIFNVVDYGAIPNDDVSDKVAIQKTIDAANKNGSGVVFFPKGRFLVNEDNDATNSIISKSSKIIFRGSGSGKDGTELYMKNPLPPADPAKMWTVPPIFIFGSGGSDKKIGEVTTSAVVGSKSISVNTTADLKAGDWIILKLLDNSKELAAAELKSYKVEPEWTYLYNKGIDVKVYHQIQKVENNALTLVTPITYNIDPKYKWEVLKFANSEEVGIEDLAFVGNWQDKFVHHRSWKDDSGFTMLRISRSTNSWLKNCRFTDCSVAAIVTQSANVSVISCVIDGNAGHEAICSNGATNVLIANCTDLASQWHSFGSSHGAMNTVIWKSTYPATTSFESHASQPRNTLLDNVEGGLMNGRGGGALENMPNHMQGLVMWNYKQTNAAEKDFEFWPDSRRFKWWKIPNPVIVGFTSAGTTFIQEQLGQGESLDKTVEPKSLYEAQLKLRLKKLPKWFLDLK